MGLTQASVEYAEQRESLVDGLVGLFRGVIAARRDACYGALQITEDQERELANGLVQNLLADHYVRRTP